MTETRIRLRISTETIESIVKVGSGVAQTVMSLNSIRSGLQVKKSLERQYKINSALEQAKNITDIGTGIAKATAVLIGKG